MYRPTHAKDYNNRRMSFCYLIFAVVFLVALGRGTTLANYVSSLEMYCSDVDSDGAHEEDYDIGDTLCVSVGDTVYFCARCNHGENPDHEDLDWSWDFGCGHSDSDWSPCGCSENPDDLDEHTSHTYSLSEAGEYCPKIIVEVQNENGSERDMNVHVHVVEVYKIQYNDPIHGYTDITGTLYVKKGTTVTFKAVEYPSPYWPSGKPVWGGEASSTPDESTTANVTFDTASTSSTDYKTVTVQCGNTKSLMAS